MSSDSDIRAELIASGVLVPCEQRVPRPVRSTSSTPVLRIDGHATRAARRLMRGGDAFDVSVAEALAAQRDARRGRSG